MQHIFHFRIICLTSTMNLYILFVVIASSSAAPHGKGNL